MARLNQNTHKEVGNGDKYSISQRNVLLQPFICWSSIMGSYCILGNCLSWDFYCSDRDTIA